MTAATTAEWLTAAAIGTAAYLPIVAAAAAAGTDLPDVPTTVRDIPERTRFLLALAQLLDTRKDR